MDEKNGSKSPLLEETPTVSEDNDSTDPEEWVMVSKHDHVLIIFCYRKATSEQCKEVEEKEE